MNTETTHSQECIDTCNGLLRGELSAVETYNQAIEKFTGDSACSELTRIRDEHAKCAEKLRAHVARMGGKPCSDSGVWGAFAKSVQGAANLFGDESALQSLQEGEAHGRNDYQRALDDVDVLADSKRLIRTELLPKVREHIAALGHLED